MDLDFRLVGLAFASIALVSTVFYYVIRLKELRVLREIRDRLPPGRNDST